MAQDLKAMLQQTARKPRRAARQRKHRALIGFDGFVDEIIDVGRRPGIAPTATIAFPR